MAYMTTDPHTNQSGMLEVGDGHTIWWQDWGNPMAKEAIFLLHGGPGSGSKDKFKLNFDPKVQRVIFHDQRGSGQSTPLGETAHNTTQDLVEDIERLRQHLHLEKIMLNGGSWGSCLALAYAQKYPSNVSKMLLGGIYLGTKQEIDYIQQGGLKTHYPEAWQQYIQVVPSEFTNNTIAFYDSQFQKPFAECADFVRRWCLLEVTAMSIDSDYKSDELKSYELDEALLSFAKLEAHYFKNNCFLQNNQLLANASKLADIPTILMHGRHDHVCPPENAYALAQAMGNNCYLHIMPGGHANELVTREVLRAYARTFLTA